MKHVELVYALSKKCGVPIHKVNQILHEMAYFVKISLSRKEQVRIARLGVFRSEIRKPRRCINPRTGEEMMTEKTIYPKFTAFAELKDFINDRVQI